MNSASSFEIIPCARAYDMEEYLIFSWICCLSIASSYDWPPLTRTKSLHHRRINKFSEKTQKISRCHWTLCFLGFFGSSRHLSEYESMEAARPCTGAATSFTPKKNEPPTFRLGFSTMSRRVWQGAKRRINQIAKVCWAFATHSLAAANIQRELSN